MEWSDFIDSVYPTFIESNYQLCTDSRALKPGDVFLCLKGDRFDGNQFAVQAIEQGARLVIVDSDALKSTLKIAGDLLQSGKELHVIKLDGKDPSDMGFAHFTTLVQQAEQFTFSDLFSLKLEVN